MEITIHGSLYCPKITIQASGMRVVFDEDGNSRDPLELLASSGQLGDTMSSLTER